MIFWKRMNWFWCQLVQVVHRARHETVSFGGQEVKGQGHIRSNRLGGGIIHHPFGWVAFLVLWWFSVDVFKTCSDKFCGREDCEGYWKLELEIDLRFNFILTPNLVSMRVQVGHREQHLILFMFWFIVHYALWLTICVLKYNYTGWGKIKYPNVKITISI